MHIDHLLSRAARRGVLSAFALTLLAAGALAPSPASAAEPAINPKVSTPFDIGVDAGYACFRIPSVVRTVSGDLLAFAEGRVDDCTDDTHVDILVKRSTNNGQSWDPAAKVVVGATDDFANGNPSPVVDTASGRVSLVYASSKVHDRGNRTVRVVNSEDGGTTWGEPRQLPTYMKPEWGWVSVGPGHGIQLTRGAHKGRLVVTGDHKNKDNLRAGAQLYVSDDGGQNWTLGAYTDTPAVAPAGSTAVPQQPGEVALVERTDGSLLFNARDRLACGYNERRLDAESTDGGNSFTRGFEPVGDLDSPPVFGSLLRLNATDTGDAGNRILYSGSSSTGSTVADRKDLTIRSTTDEGRTWSGTGTVVAPGFAGYSDLTLLAPGTVGMVYESALSYPHGRFIRFSSFTDGQLKAQETVVREQRTTDSAGDHRDSPAVQGGPVQTSRGAGKALALDGVDDQLQTTSCSPDLQIGAADFTLTAWFRYSATSGAHPILWAYGQGPDAPQFWLRAEPGNGRIHGLVDTGAGRDAVDVTVPGAYNDGSWHLAVLTREGKQLRLSVDGTATGVSAAGADASGAITPADPPVLRVGSRPDGMEHFAGALDEVRLFARALTPAEAEAAGNSAAVDATTERFRLGFSALWN
ncbi:sialidase family protein [Streptomyces sp. NPDC047981]|uniref:sialidase family protein n=1 Tax=Streptomyces sp. NPDC047981 TaxID=3154610 RepID=UPI00341AE45A